jgi:hypothetical protein
MLFARRDWRVRFFTDLLQRLGTTEGLTSEHCCDKLGVTMGRRDGGREVELNGEEIGL